MVSYVLMQEIELQRTHIDNLSRLLQVAQDGAKVNIYFVMGCSLYFYTRHITIVYVYVYLIGKLTYT